MVVLGIHTVVNGVCVWVCPNWLCNAYGVFWWNNFVLLGSDSIDRVRCVELSKGKGSALKPGLRGQCPLNLNRHTEEREYRQI